MADDWLDKLEAQLRDEPAAARDEQRERVAQAAAERWRQRNARKMPARVARSPEKQAVQAERMTKFQARRARGLAAMEAVRLKREAKRAHLAAARAARKVSHPTQTMTGKRAAHQRAAQAAERALQAAAASPPAFAPPSPDMPPRTPAEAVQPPAGREGAAVPSDHAAHVLPLPDHRRGQWTKGQSGNPGGRPRLDAPPARSVADLARRHVRRAIGVLARVLDSDSATPQAKIQAAEAILNRAEGKPPVAPPRPGGIAAEADRRLRLEKVLSLQREISRRDYEQSRR